MATTDGLNRGDEALLTVGEVAELLSCSRRHVARLAAAGRMPGGVHVGALRRWIRAEIETWIADGCPAVAPRKGAAR